MAEIANELIYQGLKQVQADTANLRQSVQEVRSGLTAIRVHLVAIQDDIVTSSYWSGSSAG